MPRGWRDATPVDEQREELDGAILAEIARRLRGRSDDAGLLDPVFEALPPGINTASR